MTNKLVVIINSLKVPKIKKILLYEMKFLVPNYSCLQNPWLGGYGSQIPVLFLNWICWPPPAHEQNSWVRHCTQALARTFLIWPLLPTRRRGRGLLQLTALNDTSTHSAWFPWTWDRPIAETPIWQQTIFTRDRIHAQGGIRTHNPSTQAAPGIGSCAYTIPKFMTVLYETCHWVQLHSTLLHIALFFSIFFCFTLLTLYKNAYPKLSLLLMLLELFL